MGPVNAFTIDVEDYFHASALASAVGRDQWDSVESRVESCTSRVLQIASDNGVIGTFFVLGWVAERFPRIVHDIESGGHEIACHGYSHQLVYNQKPEEFRQETIRAKGVIEDLIGRQVNGYRAASYSITPRSYWALDTLIEVGFTYDSSIFPVKHDRYGDPAAPRFPYRIERDGIGSIIEFPLSTWNLLGTRVPVAGGGYFRIFPYWLIKRGLRSINAKESMPFIFYLHPWEIDVNQPRFATNALSHFRHYHNLDRTEDRLARLLREFEFTTVESVLSQVPVAKIRAASK